MSRSSLHLPQSCAQSWAAMTPTAAGRHCAACQKVVVDFTHQTDAELLAYFRQAAGAGTCGRFRAGQLGRPLQPAASTSRWRSWLGAVLTLGGVLGSGRAAAQSSANFHPGPVPAEAPVSTQPSPLAASQPAPKPAPAPVEAGRPLLVRGIVTDAATGEPLPGITVLLKGTSLGASTDEQGAFSLPVGSEHAGGLVEISGIGYLRAERLVASAQAPLAVPLVADGHVLMGEVIVTSVGKRPWPWHPQALYRWGKYWLTRPFRR